MDKRAKTEYLGIKLSDVELAAIRYGMAAAKVENISEFMRSSAIAGASRAVKRMSERNKADN